MEQLIDLLPYLLTILIVVVPSSIAIFKKFGKLQKEIGEAIGVTTEALDEIADVVNSLSKGFENDGKLDRQELNLIKDEITDVRIKIGPFLKEWKDVYISGKGLIGSFFK